LLPHAFPISGNFTPQPYGIMMSSPSPPSRLAELDALRGVAAIIVVLFHYTWHGDSVVPALRLIPWGVSWGGYGVALFFAISGFVIFMTLERTRSASDFLVSRFARLFPAYWFAVGLTTLGLALLGTVKLAQPPGIVLVNLTMLQGFLYLPSVDGVYWSLSVELGFYACMLALWRLRWLRQIEVILLGWMVLTLLWWEFPNLSSAIRGILALRYIPWFAIGMVAYRVRARERTWGQQVPVLLMGLACIATTEGLADAGVFIIVTAIFAALVSGRLTFLNHRVLLWLGGISYPLYLIHQYLGYAVMIALQDSGVPSGVTLICTLAAALVAAHCIHLFIEQPSLTAIRGWWKNRRTAATA
jgi:peptidoglycan/LPS O-acetylase OafA/YrhL